MDSGIKTPSSSGCGRAGYAESAADNPDSGNNGGRSCRFPRNLAAGFRLKRMDTSTQPTSSVMKPPNLHHLAATILPAALLLSQCAPTPTPKPTKDTAPCTATAVAVPSRHWVKVSSRPPTFYPRGVAADCPTDCQSGEWVHTGDALNSRYFIPLHGCGGIPRQTLVKEALAARSARKQLRSSAEDCAICIKETGNIVVGVPLTMLALYGASASSPNQTVDDLELIRPFGF